MHEHTHLDLFSGIGGFSFGLEAAGFRTIAFAETDADASIVLKHYWPNVPNLGDVRGVRAGIIERPFIVTGGVPCQPASALGQMRGTADERWLWPEAIRILSELRPRYGIFENPPSLLGLEDGAAWNGIVSGMVALGFDCWWDVFPAAAFGAGHLRDRVILIVADACCRRRETGAGLRAGESCWQRWGRLGNDDCSTAPDANGPRLQGHAEDAPRYVGRPARSRSASAPADLRGRVKCPNWWHEAHTGIPVLANGLPSRLVEAVSRCTGNAILPQIPYLIGQSINQVEAEALK